MLARVASAASAAGSFANGELNSGSIARDADDEQVAETLAEDELRRDARVGTAEHDRERLLSRAGTASRTRPVCNEAPISLTQARQRFLSRDQNRTPAPSRSVRGGTRDRTRP